jgi:hypothetical protein
LLCGSGKNKYHRYCPHFLIIDDTSSIKEPRCKYRAIFDALPSEYGDFIGAVAVFDVVDRLDHKPRLLLFPLNALYGKMKNFFALQAPHVGTLELF